MKLKTALNIFYIALAIFFCVIAYTIIIDEYIKSFFLNMFSP